MVLSKAEFDEKSAFSIANTFKTVCQIIDNRLLIANLTTHVEDVTAHLPIEFHKPSYVEKLIEQIIEEYRRAGWKVERINGYDQRDGDSWDYLQFS